MLRDKRQPSSNRQVPQRRSRRSRHQRDPESRSPQVGHQPRVSQPGVRQEGRKGPHREEAQDHRYLRCEEESQGNQHGAQEEVHSGGPGAQADVGGQPPGAVTHRHPAQEPRGHVPQSAGDADPRGRDSTRGGAEVLPGEIAHGHHGVAEGQRQLWDHQQYERRAEGRRRRHLERGEGERGSAELRPGRQPRADDAGGHERESRAEPTPSGGQGDQYEGPHRQGHRPGRGWRSPEHLRGLQHQAGRGDRQEHPHPELQRPDHGLGEQPCQEVGDPVDREEQEEQTDLQSRGVDDLRGQPLGHGHRGEGLEGLDGERDPEGQPGGYDQEPGHQHDRACVETVHQDERGRQGNQDPEVRHRSGGISQAETQPPARGRLRPGVHGLAADHRHAAIRANEVGVVDAVAGPLRRHGAADQSF